MIDDDLDPSHRRLERLMERMDPTPPSLRRFERLMERITSPPWIRGLNRLAEAMDPAPPAVRQLDRLAEVGTDPTIRRIRGLDGSALRAVEDRQIRGVDGPAIRAVRQFAHVNDELMKAARPLEELHGPALQAVQQFSHVHDDLMKALRPFEELHGPALRAARQFADVRPLIPLAPAIPRIGPLLDRAARFAAEVNRVETGIEAADKEAAGGAWWAYRNNRLAWLMEFTVHELHLDHEHVEDVMTVLGEGGWRRARNPVAYLAGAARRRRWQRLQKQPHLLPNGQDWKNVETLELYARPETGIDTDPGLAMNRLLAQLDLRRELPRKLPADDAWIAVLLKAYGCTRDEVCQHLGLTQQQLEAAVKRMERLGVCLASRRSPRRQ